MSILQPPMQLVDWLDDICVRFIINLPREELESVERIIFQIEEGHWYYEDFIRPLDPTLPSIGLKHFCSLIFQHCPLLAGFSHFDNVAYAEFSAYKTRVPVRGAIMLNQDMSQAVLVKGWKKGAKWSFPRGKINKDESDYDCAIREVYEETGYDVRAAGITTSEQNAKYIDVTLREQQMRLYVFRGVPMDTYFEPRTRKEISKIDWYNITDLPGGKSKKQARSEDTQKGSNFYMVAPFMTPLKLWIKQQRKRDRLHAGLNAPEPVLVEDSGIGTDMEAMAPEVAENNEAEARHFQSLLSRLNQSSQVPHESHLPSATGLGQTDELAAQLKKMLSIGVTETMSQPPQPAPSVPDRGGSLMALLRPQSSSLAPQTPLEHIDPSPPLARTPHHHPPGLPQFHPNGPPPRIQYSPALQHHQSNVQAPFANTSAPYHHEPSPYQGNPPPYVPDFQPFPGPHGEPMLQRTLPQEMQSLSHPPPQPIPRTVPDQAIMQHQLREVPAASSLPVPKLTAHSLSLLNSFKSQPTPNHVISPPQQLPPLNQQTHLAPINSMVSSLDSVGSASLMRALGVQPQFPPPEVPPELEGAKVPFSKPKNAQANSLLNLFRAPSGNSTSEIGSASRPAELALPVAELSAGTPQKDISQRAAMKPTQRIQTNIPLPNSTSQLTSATVSGPLNSPNFESVVRNRPIAELGNGQEKAPTPVPVHTVAPSMPLEAPRAIHPLTILQRQITPSNVPAASQPSQTSQPQVPAKPSLPLTAAFDRRGTLGAEQQSALMSLFGKQTTGVPLPSQALATGGVSLDHQRRQSQNSPVSPLPDRRLPVRQVSAQSYDAAATTPTTAVALARSRVSSFAEENTRASTSPKTPITPVERKFLFQYLEDVVSKEGKR